MSGQPNDELSCPKCHGKYFVDQCQTCEGKGKVLRLSWAVEIAHTPDPLSSCGFDKEHAHRWIQWSVHRTRKAAFASVRRWLKTKQEDLDLYATGPFAKDEAGSHNAMCRVMQIDMSEAARRRVSKA